MLVDVDDFGRLAGLVIDGHDRVQPEVVHSGDIASRSARRLGLRTRSRKRGAELVLGIGANLNQASSANRNSSRRRQCALRCPTRNSVSA